MEALRQIRIFVSSTFSDFHIERKALQEKVFPRLRDYCESLGWRFQAIDLRWGVSREAGLDQQTMRICLEEINRCRTVSPRPNFIVLLGDRYGWRPLPEEIPAFEFEEIRRRADPISLDLLEWRDDQAPGAKGWYRRNDNILVRQPGRDDFQQGLYQLQSRTGRFEDFCVWEREVEKPLLRTMIEARQFLNLPKSALIKYGASATEQEIFHGALQDPDAAEHVFAFHRTLVTPQGRTWCDPPDFLDPGGSMIRSSWQDLFDTDENGHFDPESACRAAGLKALLRGHIGENNVYEYKAVWDHKQLQTEWLESFCREVEKRLRDSIRNRIDHFKEVCKVRLGRLTHQSVGRDFSHFFVGRRDELERLTKYLTSIGPTVPQAVLGPEGCGKSALLAAAAENLRALHPNTFIVERFIGATPESTLLVTLLEDLANEIGEHYNEQPVSISNAHQASGLIAQRLALADPTQPLALFIDDLDQIQTPDEINPLAWLPKLLPSGVRLVISANLERETFPEQRSRSSPYVTWFDESSRLFLNGFSCEDACEALDVHLSRQSSSSAAGSYDTRRTLTDEQRRVLLNLFTDETTPFFHRLISETARLWPSWKSRPVLPDSMEDMVQTLLEELSAPARHGRVLVQSVCAYLLASRHGLSEEEMLDLLSRDELLWDDFLSRSRHHLSQGRSLPAVIFLRLQYDLERLLVSRLVRGGTTLGFSRRCVASAIRNNFLAVGKIEACHNQLADYFLSRPWQRGATGDLRNLSECCYHPLKARRWKDLEATLFNFGFIECFCESFETEYKNGLPIDHQGVMFLISDLTEIINEPNLPSDLRTRTVTLRTVLKTIAPQTRLFPDGVTQQVFNHLAANFKGAENESFVSQGAERHLRDSGRMWFRARLPETDLASKGKKPVLLSTHGDFDLVTCGPDDQFFCLELRSNFDFSLMVWDADECRPAWIVEDRSNTDLKWKPVAARWLKKENKILFIRKNGEVCLADWPDRRVETVQTLNRAVSLAQIQESGLIVVCDEQAGAVRIEAFYPAGQRVMSFELPSPGQPTALTFFLQADRFFLSMADWPDRVNQKVFQVKVPEGPYEVLGRLDMSHAVSAMAVDDDGRHLALGTVTGGIRVMNADSGEVVAAAPSWAEQRLAAWKRETWCLGEADDLGEPPALREKVSTLAFINDGRRVLAASCPPARRYAPGGLLALDLETGTTHDFGNYYSGINSFDFLPDRQKLIAAGYEALFTIDLNIKSPSGSKPASALPFGDTLECAALSPTGNQAALSYSGIIHLVEAPSLKIRRMIRSEAGYLKNLKWIGDNLLGLGADGRIRAWDPATGVSLASYPPDGAQRASFTCFSASQRNRFLVLAGRGEELVLFRDDGSMAVRNLGYPISNLGLSPDGCLGVAVLDETVCFAFSTTTWEPLGGLEGVCRVSGVVLFDEETVLTLYADGGSVLWKAETGEKLESFSLPNLSKFNVQGYLVRAQAAFLASRDDFFMITIHGDDTCRAWRNGSPHPIGELPLSFGAQAARIAPSGRELIIVDGNGVWQSYQLEF